jgi:arylsulfatase A-like enzyme
MPDQPPNIVFITTDQQRYDTVNALGAEFMDTPNLDRLVEEGVTFIDCHITAPSCAPSRASLFTGYYPHTTGIFRNGDRWTHSWIEDLSDSGYYTVNIGKMHTAPYDAPMGFDERYEVENKDRYLAAVPGGEPPLPGEKFYLDEWDRALQTRGYLKQQREFYRQ